MAVIKLFEDQDANANGDTFNFVGGKCMLLAFGTFDTCSMTVQVSHNGTEWINYSTVTAITAAKAVDLELPAGIFIRGVMASVGASTSASLVLIG
jgi:hypothetical protein